MTLEKGSACVKMAYLGSEMPGKGDGVFEKARKRRISSHTSFNTSLGRRGRESQDGAYRIIGIDYLFSSIGRQISFLKTPRSALAYSELSTSA